MKIQWFSVNAAESGSYSNGHLFDTEGELPVVGTVVFINNMTGENNQPMTRNKYIVKRVDIVLDLYARDFKSFEFVSDDAEKRYYEMEQQVLKESALLTSYDYRNHRAIISRQEAQVYLERV